MFIVVPAFRRAKVVSTGFALQRSRQRQHALVHHIQARAVLLGFNAPALPDSGRGLEQRLRERCEAALAGVAVAVEDWLDIADVVLAPRVALPARDVLLVLQACELQVEDPSLFAALVEHLHMLAPSLELEDVLVALQILGRLRERVGRARRAQTFGTETPISALYKRLQECALADAPSLVRTLAALGPGGLSSAEVPALPRSLASTALEARGLSYHDMVAVELSFESLGMFHGPLAQLLTQRRVLYLEGAPLSTLLQMLLDAEADKFPPWFPRSTEAERALLQGFLARLEADGNSSADIFRDPFACLSFLVRQQCLPTSFIMSLCQRVRRATRRGGGRWGPVTPSQLVALDDACEARRLEGTAREQLDAAIRAVVVFGMGWDEAIPEESTPGAALSSPCASEESSGSAA